MVLEQYLHWRMPNDPKAHPSFDGKPHAVIVTVDEMSKALLRFVIREEADPDDHARFARETAAFDGHLQQMSAFLAEAQAAQNIAYIRTRCEAGVAWLVNITGPIAPGSTPVRAMDSRTTRSSSADHWRRMPWCG